MNCKLGMGLADDKLGIPQIMDPEDLNHPNVDEISVMTYISYFCTPANTHLLKWVQEMLPQRNIKNFTTDWNDGINLGYLLEALNPGGFPDCKSLDARNAKDNLDRCMKAANDQLGIKPVLTPAQMADPNVDELNIVTYIARFQNAKPLPQPQAISCSGEGLRKAIVGKEAVFEVDTTRGGSGDLSVEIDCSGKPLKADVTPNFGNKTVFSVKYTPQSAGKVSIAIKWSNTEIPSSPYTVNIVDPGAVSLTGPQITGKECARVGEMVKMEAKGVLDAADLEVKVEFSSGHIEQAKLAPGSKGLVNCSYTPSVVGVDKVTATVSGMPVPGSPFKVKVIDPSLLSVELTNPAQGKPLLISDKGTFVVSASKGSAEGVLAQLVSPKGSQEVSLKEEGSKCVGTFTPKFVGKQEIHVTCAGNHIKGSPISLLVSDPTKCSFLEDLPSVLHVGESRTVVLSVQGAGEGSAGTKSSDAGILDLECKEASGGEKYDIKLNPKKVGEATVNVDWNGQPVPKTPHKISVCDVTCCAAIGVGLISGKGKTREPFEFTVEVKGAGNGELAVNTQGPKSTHASRITKNPDGTYKVSFTTPEIGIHTIRILWSGKDVSDSPYSVDFYKPAEASSFTATGDGLSTAVAMSTAKFLLIGHESGLLASGMLKISITGNNLTSTTVAKQADFKPTGGKVVVFATDDKKGHYNVNYVAPTAGKYSIAITSDSDHIPGSPFQLNVLPAPDASKCVAFGHAIDNPSSLVVEKPVEFKVDATEAGTGTLSVTAKDPKGSTIPVFIAEDKSDSAKKLYSVKIDPKMQGKHEVSVKWSEQQIPKSPFVFDVSDPKQVIILDLADSADYIGRKGEPISFSVDTRKAGPGELKAAAKLEDGKVEVYTQKTNKDKTIKLSYTPTGEGKLELLLTFAGVSILPRPWIIDVTDVSSLKAIPPKEASKVNEYVKFAIIGLSKKQAKNIVISARNNGHDPLVKLEFGDKVQSFATFVPKDRGEYTVEVKAAKKDVPGSPFKCKVVNPDSITIEGTVPTTIPVGAEKSFFIDTTKAGPGELTCEYTSEGGAGIILATISGGQNKEVKIIGKKCGKTPFNLKFEGYPIPTMPVDVIVTDPAQCKFSSKEIESGFCKTTDSITVNVDTSSGGSCTPQVTVRGPKSKYDIELKKAAEGKYTTTLTPWQDGENSLQVTVGGKDVTGSPKKFESMKPLDASKVTVGGPALKGAITNRRAEVTIYARESMLVDRGVLSVSFEDKKQYDLEVYDQQNGTYSVSFVPTDVGSLKLKVTGEGSQIAGSPFNIAVLPEPDPSKCIVQNRSGESVFVDSSSVYHMVRTPFELQVITTNAGTGTLKASGKTPTKGQLRVFTNNDKVGNDNISYIKFDPTSVGVYTLSITWDGQQLAGAPYQIKVVDPSKCVFDTPFRSSVMVEDEVTYEVNTSSAGEGELEVFPKGPEARSSVVKKKPGVFAVGITGVKLGSTTVDMQYGGFSLPSTPYALSICDPSKCTTNFAGGVYNINTPFKFSVQVDNAGRAKLQVVPSMKATVVIRNPEESRWEVSVTPKEVGVYTLRIMWGEWDISGGPFTFTTCDPGNVKVEGLPDPNELLLIGEPISFTVDHSEAGKGELVCHTVMDGKKSDLSWEETDDGIESDIMSLQFVPDKPGKIQLVLQYNGMDILLRPHVYDVPDPSQFKVTPPKGYGKIKEYVKFGITGVKKDTELVITAHHPNHEATVKTEQGADSNTIIARMTPKEIGEYAVEVKHAGQHIDGSPFTVLVCNPDACRFVTDPPSVIHVGVEPNIQVDPSDAGPGELNFESEIVSGVEDATTSTEDKTQWILAMKESVGKIKVYARWAGYDIPGSPFVMAIVNSKLVKWSCDVLDQKEFLHQGDILKILIDGSEAGDCVPEILAKGPEEDYPAKIADNENGTYTAIIHPWQLGANEVRILWAGCPIPDMPITFEVLKGIDTKAITVSGSGLESAVAGTEDSVTINALESGLLNHGELEVTMEPKEEGEDPPIYDVTDEGEGMYKVTFTAPKAGTYILSVKFEGQHITKSPFDIIVGEPASAEKCRAFGEAVEKTPALFNSHEPVKFSVDTSEAGHGSLTFSATQPDGTPTQVYTIVEDSVHHLKFDPVAIGHYNTAVQWGGADIPGSPFDFNVVDPSKCVVRGLPANGARIQSNELLKFSVKMANVGDCSPSVVISFKDEETILEPVDSADGVFNYTYTPKGFGKISLSITTGGTHVPTSPLSYILVDADKFTLIKVHTKGEHAIVCEPVVLEIQGQSGEDEQGELMVTAHGPTADLSVAVVQESEDIHKASFIPIEPGSYEVFVEYGGKHVNNSPCSVKVADPSKCQLLGGAITTLQVKQSDEITVKTRGAGEGELEAVVTQEDDSPIALDAEVTDLGLDTYSIKLTGTAIGKANIDLQWAGYTIPGTPFTTKVCDATKCKAYGEALTSQKGKAGSAIKFMVETTDAGDGELEVTAKGPSAQYVVSIDKVTDTTYEVTFTPWEIGAHNINVLWSKADIPGSPFMVNVGNPLEMEVCNATGDGLKHAIAGQKAKFTILCSEVGLLDKNVLKVTIMGVTVHAEVTILDNNNGSYAVEYVPPIPGAYVASILFHNRQIPGSPFKITVDPGPDASKCKAYGPALHPNALAIAGSPLEFFVDTSAAGYGHLKVYIQGPKDYKPKVYTADDEKGIYSIKFDAMKPGKYFAVVVWSEKHIPKSPFQIRVQPAADAGKVRAYGPGLLDGFIGTPGQFNIETKNAGIGTLLIRIHGLKDSFKIEAKPISPEDTRTLIVTYNPKLVGEYTVFVRWSGVHISGSPFTVNIKQKPGMVHNVRTRARARAKC